MERRGQQVNRWVQQAEEAAHQADFVRAVALYSKTLEEVEGTRSRDELSERQIKWITKVLVRRARAFKALGNLYRCIQDANRALSFKTGLEKAYVLKGYALLEQDQCAAANETFCTGLEHFPTNNLLQRGFNQSLQGIRKQRHRHSCMFAETFWKGQANESLCDTAFSVNESQSLVLRSGATLDLSDIYEKEAKFWSRNYPHEGKFSIARERDTILKLLSAHKESLFAAFISHLSSVVTTCEVQSEVGHVTLRRTSRGQLDGSISKKSRYNSSGSFSRSQSTRRNINHGKKIANSPTIALLREFDENPEPKEQVVPIGIWSRMTENQFWHFAVNCNIMSNDFGEEAFAQVWKKITTNEYLRKSQTDEPESKGPDETKSTGDAGGIIKEEEEKQQGVEGVTSDYILFPKFIEGVARLLANRYQPASRPEQSTQLTRGALPLTLSQRLLHAVDVHVISPLDNESKTHNPFGTVTTALKQYDELRSIFEKDARVQKIKELYLEELHRVFRHFSIQKVDMQQEDGALEGTKSVRKGDTERKEEAEVEEDDDDDDDDDEEEGITLAQIVHFFYTIGFINRYHRHLDTVISTCVAVSKLLGCHEHERLGFDDFFEVLLWCCQVGTRDGLIPLGHRLESFLLHRVFRNVQEKTDIGSLFHELR